MDGAESSGRRRWRPAARPMLVVACLAVVAWWFPAPAAAQASGVSQTTIRVDLEGGFVEVEEVLRPSSAGPLQVLLPATATDVRVDAPFVEVTVDGSYRALELDAGPGPISLTYRVPGDEPGSGSIRVDDSMVAFELWPNLDQAGFRVVLPAGFEANPGPAWTIEPPGDGGATVPTDGRDPDGPGTVTYLLEPTDLDLIWGFRFIAFREAGLVRRTLEVGPGRTIELAGWVDDPGWLDFAEDHVGRGVAVLEELVDRPWPVTELELVESAAPAQEGYGGWYDLRAAQIEVADVREPELLLHELSHAWFNGTVFEQRWMVEGFAEAYAQAAVAALGADGTGFEAPGPEPAGFDGLNGWRSRFFFEDTWDAEYHGYLASAWVVHRLLDEIGPDRMAAVLADVFERRHPFAADGDREVTGTNDWRRLLDLLELRGGSTRAEELFRLHVVTDGQEALLDRRRAALDAYLDFEETMAGGDRAEVPEGIRYAMSDWDFDTALRAIDRAAEARQRLDELGGRAAALGLVLPAHLESMYLDAGTGFGRLTSSLDATASVLEALEGRADSLSATDRRNFSLGRFDRLDPALFPPDQGTALDRDLDGGSDGRWYLLASGVLVLALVVTAVVAVGLPQDEGPLAGPPSSVR